MYFCGKTLFFLLIAFKLGNCKLNTNGDRVHPELAYLNTSVDPCENFYAFACGNFKNVYPMPDDINVKIWDHFTIMQKEIHDLVQDILESPISNHDDSPTSLNKAKTFYKACVDTTYSDKLKLAHVDVLNEYGDWPAIVKNVHKWNFSWKELGDMIAEFGVQFFFNFQVIPNNFDGTENVILFQEDSLANPPNIHDYFEEDLDDRIRSLFDRKDELIPLHVFFNTIAFRLRDIRGYSKSNSDVSKDILETITFMQMINAKGIVEDDAEIQAFNRTMTISELQQWTNKHFGKNFLDWMTFLQRVFKYSGTIIKPDMRVMATSANNTYGILNLMRKTDDRVLRNFIFARLFTYMAPDSDSYMRKAFNSFYEHFNWPVYPRDKYCIRKILGYSGYIDLSYALTYEYQKYHFNINKLTEAQEMIDDLHESFQDILTDNTWMDGDSKAKALAKAQKMLTLLGFPDIASTADSVDEFYKNLRVCSWDHSANARKLRAFRQALNFRQMKTGRERDVWTLSPLEVNAVYNRPNNRILLPISMLNSVFFGNKLSALDYGRIGTTIGHEITHGFDDSGRLYDENGNMANWWSAETQQAYTERVQCYKEQYGQYYIEEIDKYVDSTKTLNENIADNGGVREAYRAFQKLQKKRELQSIGGYTSEQLFFIGYGTMWCMSETNYYLSEMQSKSGYAPGRYRVMGAISNMEEFSEAFRCPPGAPMNPTNKCVLW